MPDKQLLHIVLGGGGTSSVRNDFVELFNDDGKLQLRELASPGIVSESLRKYLQAEVQRRIRAGEKSARKDDTPGPAAASNQN